MALQAITSLAEGNIFSGLASAVSKLTAEIDTLRDSFHSMAGTIAPFVEAFQPSAVLEMSQALRDTAAVTGSIVVPAFEALSGIARDVGDTLIPLSKSMAPVVRQLTDVFSRLARQGITLFAGLASAIGPSLAIVLDGLTTVLEPLVRMALSLGEVFAGLVAVIGSGMEPILETIAAALAYVVGGLESFISPLRAVAVLLHGLAEAMKGSVSAFLNLDNAKSAINDLRETMAKFSRQVLVAVAALAKFAGIDSLVRGMINGLGDTKKGSSVGFAAAQNAQVTDIQSFNRQLIANAAVAAGGANKSAEDTWREETLKALRDVASGKTDVFTLIEGAKTLLAGLPKGLVDMIIENGPAILKALTSGLPKGPTLPTTGSEAGIAALRAGLGTLGDWLFPPQKIEG